MRFFSSSSFTSERCASIHSQRPSSIARSNALRRSRCRRSSREAASVVRLSIVLLTPSTTVSPIRTTLRTTVSTPCPIARETSSSDGVSGRARIVARRRNPFAPRNRPRERIHRFLLQIRRELAQLIPVHLGSVQANQPFEARAANIRRELHQLRAGQRSLRVQHFFHSSLRHERRHSRKALQINLFRAPHSPACLPPSRPSRRRLRESSPSAHS